MNGFAIPLWIKTSLLGLGMCGVLGGAVYVIQPHSVADSNSQPTTSETSDSSESEVVVYDVISVVDGDTVKINYEGQETSVRLIGVNTPETVDPRKSVECFGEEASKYLKELLEGKKVTIEADSTQSDRDKYNRLLRYVYLDGKDINLDIMTNGYGYEYTYEIPYKKQADYKKAQQVAEDEKKGLWADGVCETSTTASTSSSESQTQTTPAAAQQTTPQASTPTDCNIKGNISSSGEKIYHVPGQKYYDSTRVDTSAGERMFCSEQEAVDAGWRKSKV